MQNAEGMEEWYRRIDWDCKVSQQHAEKSKSGSYPIIPRLNRFEAQCAACLAATPPDPQLADENLRGYVVLLSAHFQAFARSLYGECSQILVSKVRTGLQSVMQRQFTIHRLLDHGNPNLDNLARDFARFGFDLRGELSADPANLLRLQHLAEMNQWRNVAAHQGATLPAGIPLTHARVLSWHHSCDDLVVAIDAILYNQLKKLLRRNPW